MLLRFFLGILLIGGNQLLFSLADTNSKNSFVDCLIRTINLTAKRKIALEFTKGNQDIVSEILQKVNVPVVLNTVEHRIPTEIELRAQVDVFVLLKHTKPAKILNDTLWNGDTRFIVVTQDEETVEDYFEQFWKLKVINVFGMVMTEGNISVYSFLPYGKENCMKAELIVVDSCFEGKLQNEGSALKDRMRLKNMNQCPINVTISEIRPGLIFEAKPSWKNSSTVRGFEGNFIMEVAKLYNFNATFKISEDGFGWGWIYPSPRGAIGDLWRGLTDITVGLQAPLMQRYQFLDLSTNYYTDECVTFGMPQGYGSKTAAWLTNFVLEFTFDTWILIIISFIMVSISKWLINTYIEINWFSSKSDTVLFVLSICLELPIKIPHFKSSKISVLFWIIFTFIIKVAYKASMESLLIVPPRDADIKDFKELLDSDLVLIGLKNQIQLLAVTKEWPFTEMLERYQFSEVGLGEMVQRMANREKIAALYPKASFYYYSLINEKARGRIHVINECVYPYKPYAIMKKFSPFTRRVSQTVRRLEESGIMVMWRAERVKKIPPPKKPFFKLSMYQILGIFCFLILGYVVATVAFLWEVNFHFLFWKTLCSICQCQMFYFPMFISRCQTVSGNTNK